MKPGSVHVMTVQRGRNGVTAVDIPVTVIREGVGQHDCIECEGRGIWDYGPDEEPVTDCVECKGQGRVFCSL